MSEFYSVKSASEARELIFKNITPVTKKETIGYLDAVGRISFADIAAPYNLPGFKRSTMDGYAVRAEDVYGATEGMPAYLDIIGKVEMGEQPTIALRKGGCVQIATGAMLPEGADSVVMIEYTAIINNGLVEITKQVSPGENILLEDEDFRINEVFIKKGTRLRPVEIGALAGFGILNAEVYARPRIAVIATGDEIAKQEEELRPGKIRDINSYYIIASLQQAGCDSFYAGRSGDTEFELYELISSVADKADCIIVSGGSSIGARDITLAAVERFSGKEAEVRGISVRPGKPTIFAASGKVPIFGLPGHPSSAASILSYFVLPGIEKMCGLQNVGIKSFVFAQAAVNFPSVAGREDYIRVSVEANEQGELFATPIYGKSAVISSVLRSNGVVCVPADKEGIVKGENIKVMLFGGN